MVVVVVVAAPAVAKLGTATTGPTVPKGPGSKLLLPKSEPDRGRAGLSSPSRVRFFDGMVK